MTDLQRTPSPVDGSILAERCLATDRQIDAALERAGAAQRRRRHVALGERAATCVRFARHRLEHRNAVSLEITRQVGRPISQSPSEVRTCVDRASTMVALAPEASEDVRPPERAGIERFIRKVPLGVVHGIAPWTHPLLAAVNTVVPAIIAGNSVILKHAPQTPLSGERFASAFEAAAPPPEMCSRPSP